MKIIRGNCGHIKARWDSHYNCLSCSLCSRSLTCSTCNQWSQSVWLLADKRRLRAMRKSVMTNRRHNKKRKRNASDPSVSISLDGSTAPHGFTARGRTHQGGIPMGDESTLDRSPPVIGQDFTGQPVLAKISPVIQSPVNQALVNQSPVRCYQVPVTDH